MEERGELFLKKISMSRAKVAKLCHTFIKDGAVSICFTYMLPLIYCWLHFIHPEHQHKNEIPVLRWKMHVSNLIHNIYSSTRGHLSQVSLQTETHRYGSDWCEFSAATTVEQRRRTIFVLSPYCCCSWMHQTMTRDGSALIDECYSLLWLTIPNTTKAQSNIWSKKQVGLILILVGHLIKHLRAWFDTFGKKSELYQDWKQLYLKPACWGWRSLLSSSEMLQHGQTYDSLYAQCWGSSVTFLLCSPQKILTHSYSRVVLRVLEKAAGEKKRFSVYVTESQPDSAGWVNTASKMCPRFIPRGHKLTEASFFFYVLCVQATDGRSSENAQCSSNGSPGCSCGVRTFLII